MLAIMATLSTGQTPNGAKAGGPIGMKVGNYVLTEAIGAGGMGAVYLAVHPEIGRKVAVKMLPRHLGLTPGLADRFRAEARAVTRIEHPNIIEIYDYGQTDDGQLYYIMELLRGHELIEDIRRYAPMPADQALPYLEQICAALQAAHDSGVVHRDLKPENIFVLDRPELTIKVLDFGLAKLLTDPDPDASQTATGQIMGTPLTIAPEQAAGRPQEIGPQTDLYSLGVILHWMLAGTPPFMEETTALLLAQHISEPAPPLLQRCPYLPPEVAEVVDRCLNKAPSDRPPSAVAVSSRFAAALDSCEATAMGLDPLEKTPLAEPRPISPELAGPKPFSPTTSGSTPSMVGELARAPGRRPTRDRNFLLAAAGLLLLLGAAAFLLTRSSRSDAPEAASAVEPPPTAAAATAPTPPDAGPPPSPKPDAAVPAQPIKKVDQPEAGQMKRAQKAARTKKWRTRPAKKRTVPPPPIPTPTLPRKLRPAPQPTPPPPAPKPKPAMGEGTVPF